MNWIWIWISLLPLVETWFFYIIEKIKITLSCFDFLVYNRDKSLLSLEAVNSNQFLNYWGRKMYFRKAVCLCNFKKWYDTYLKNIGWHNCPFGQRQFSPLQCLHFKIVSLTTVDSHPMRLFSSLRTAHFYHWAYLILFHNKSWLSSHLNPFNKVHK